MAAGRKFLGVRFFLPKSFRFASRALYFRIFCDSMFVAGCGVAKDDGDNELLRKT